MWPSAAILVVAAQVVYLLARLGFTRGLGVLDYQGGSPHCLFVFITLWFSLEVDPGRRCPRQPHRDIGLTRRDCYRLPQCDQSVVEKDAATWKRREECPRGVRLTLTGQVWRRKQIDERKSWELRCSTLQGLTSTVT